MDSTIRQHLSKDPILRPLVEQIQLKARASQNSVYEALLRAINFQQLSGKAAATIHGRFLGLFEKAFPDPIRIQQLSIEELRAVGLSRQKSAYVKNTADFFISHNLLEKDWSKEEDEAIIFLLTQIKGVGPWTVEMILMFTLQRLDVLPLDDLVIKNSMIELYGVKETGASLKKRLLEIGDSWRPYRTVASRYLWQRRDAIV